MAKPEWGTKRTCPKCGTRFYDLKKDDPVVCIECATEWKPEPILKSKQPLPPQPRKKVEKAEVEEESDEDEEDAAPSDDEDDSGDIAIEDDDGDEDVSGVVGGVSKDED